MLKIGMIDANEKPTGDLAFIHTVNSVVGNWLRWEIEQSDLVLDNPEKSDVVFLVFAGQVDWAFTCRSYLRRYGIEPEANKRQASPLIIAGGSVDASPFMALRVADILAVGEAYIFVRKLFDYIKGGASVEDLISWASDYPHSLTKDQIKHYKRDISRPWLLEDLPETLAKPDEYVDWEGTPAVRDSGNFVRVLAAKGCHLKCKFCATTYRQTYRVNDGAESLMNKAVSLQRNGGRVGLITNDAAALPYFNDLEKLGLDNQSITIKALRNPIILDALIRSNTKAVRVGMEGISPRIRQAFGKPITNDELLIIAKLLTDSKIRLTLFTIVDAPYETKNDWEEFRDLWKAMCRTIRSSMVEFKYTTFMPNAPAPLVYFVPDGAGSDEAYNFRTWALNNFTSTHINSVRPRKNPAIIKNLMEQFDIDKKTATKLREMPGTTDLAPDSLTAARFPWEIIKWPLPIEKRWRLSRSYGKWMGINYG